MAIGGAGVAPAAAQVDDGARGYLPVPAGVRAVGLSIVRTSSNQSVDPGTVVPGSRIDLTMMLTQLTGTFDWGGRLGALVPIAGLPALAPDAFARQAPGYALAALAKLTLPTGAHDPARPVNFGADRFALQLGMPMSVGYGQSWLDPRLATLEFVPAVTVYRTQHSPFGGTRLEQRPLWIAEAHATRGLGAGYWGSIDLRGRVGGQTRLDGGPPSAGQRAIALGATLGVPLARASALKLTYGRVVWRNDAGPEGWTVRATLGWSF